MGVYRNRVLPRLLDIALDNADVRQWRERCVQGLHGVVVEPGFGSGLNVDHYPAAVTKVFAVDPATAGRRIGHERIDRSPVDIEFVGLDGQALPLPDASCDTALLTYTLCTIPDAPRALAELRRVLKPDGALHFLEHGHAPQPNVATWQRRIEPMQRRLFDGCHLTRNMTEIITDAGFVIDWVEEAYSKGPKPWAFIYLGRAISPPTLAA